MIVVLGRAHSSQVAKPDSAGAVEGRHGEYAFLGWIHVREQRPLRGIEHIEGAKSKGIRHPRQSGSACSIAKASGSPAAIIAAENHVPGASWNTA